MGKILGIKRGYASCQISILAPKIVSDLRIGDSVAVNGVCLTVVQFDQERFTADVMAETLDKTNLGDLKIGELVNLERALRLGDRLGGHLVQGHVDGIGTLADRKKHDIASILRFRAPENVLAYTVAKGSIAIDGISLTVVDVLTDSFTVSLIPHTGQQTTLGFKKVGSQVNLEADIIGRYVEKLMKKSTSVKDEGLSLAFLAEKGFL